VTENDEIRAIRLRVIEIANDVVQERHSPQDAARELDRIRSDLVRHGEALDPFVGLAAAWDYDVDRRPEYEREILIAAETLRRRFGA